MMRYLSEQIKQLRGVLTNEDYDFNGNRRALRAGNRGTCNGPRYSDTC